jgi:hypothetical protein
MRANAALRFGRMYYRQISDNGIDFGLPFGSTYTLAFSRILYPTEVLVAYNVSGASRNDCIVVDAGLHAVGDSMTFLHGEAGTVPIERAPNGTLFVRLGLSANQFVVLR